MIRPRPLVAGVVGWVAGAAASVTVGLLALSQVGANLSLDGGNRVVPVEPLAQVASPQTPAPPPAGTSSTPVPPSSRATGTSSPTATDRPAQRLDSPGGYVVAQCRSGGAYLVYWSPAQGYHVDGVVRGPAATVKVTFEGRGREVRMIVTCGPDGPRATVDTEVEDESSHR